MLGVLPSRFPCAVPPLEQCRVNGEGLRLEVPSVYIYAYDVYLLANEHSKRKGHGKKPCTKGKAFIHSHTISFPIHESIRPANVSNGQYVFIYASMFIECLFNALIRKLLTCNLRTYKLADYCPDGNDSDGC